MKICNITKNGRHHSLAHRASKSSKRRSHTGRHRRIKRRISRIFRRRYKKHANPPQNPQSSNQAENTFRNFSINGNYFNKIMTQNNMNTMNNLSVNNNNMTFKSIDDKMENKKENEKPVLINIDLINHQDFTNAFINGNAIEGNEKSQYNNSVYNKNNNHLNMFNLSSPPSVKNYWK